MKKNLIISMIFLCIFLTSNDKTNNFTPFKYNNNICFPFDQGVEILEIIKLYPIQKEMIQAMNLHSSNNIEIKKLDKKERIRRGLLVGIISGVTGLLTGSCLTIRLLR